MGLLRVLLTLFTTLTLCIAYRCVERCRFDSKDNIVHTKATEDQRCFVTMPDNPHTRNDRIFPCEIEIEANCSSYCHVSLTFTKFKLEQCRRNHSKEADHCDQIDSCEYVILKEKGQDKYGVNITEIVRFDGDLTSEVFVSRTDKVSLQICYRSETFSGRNIQIQYNAMRNKVEEATMNYGPISVYVLCVLVVLFIIAIFVINWCPWLKPCLDPPKNIDPDDL